MASASSTKTEAPSQPPVPPHCRGFLAQDTIICGPKVLTKPALAKAESFSRGRAGGGGKDLGKREKLASSDPGNRTLIVDYPPQRTNISHLGKRKIIFKMPFLGDMLVPWRVFSL